MNDPFVLMYIGSFQITDALVIATEYLLTDFYSMIYETAMYKYGLPVDFVKFYAANIIFGLAHVHSKGVLFRDLKPENIMCDSKGYLKIIDFGLSKVVPYEQIDPVSGLSQVFSKTYTLCGTPEYLAPEFIYNNGHNHTADLWALGVIIFESLCIETPFAAANDSQQLFINIAMVKKQGLKLSSKIDAVIHFVYFISLFFFSPLIISRFLFLV